jgi:hypothetical protein
VARRRRRWSQLYLIRNSDRDLLKTCIWKPDNIMGIVLKRILLSWMEAGQDLFNEAL